MGTSGRLPAAIVGVRGDRASAAVPFAPPAGRRCRQADEGPFIDLPPLEGPCGEGYSRPPKRTKEHKSWPGNRRKTDTRR
ncbi:hypothetical protein CN128_31815 [Sinorhizobium meliloti]|nr:hypothetical protein SMB554_10755 [Sinorhizobium meliloti]RVG75401.1 hypothetical protein CN223_22060 [Sinorhizobium meliloti]RVH02252.1 hypothetical protein CN217_31620 [Sinorhizobium meliloti]RVI20062.1 hypothetical protein CN202_30555 [Sinorhizobium meliloti]RVK57886.1 hypothetical protein CN155_11085 [Sinorhizobium meliloti]